MGGGAVQEEGERRSDGRTERKKDGGRRRAAVFYMNNVVEMSSISLAIEHVCDSSLGAAALRSLIIFKGPRSIFI